MMTKTFVSRPQRVKAAIPGFFRRIMGDIAAFRFSRLAPAVWVAAGEIVAFYGFSEHGRAMACCAVLFSALAIVWSSFAGFAGPQGLASTGEDEPGEVAAPESPVPVDAARGSGRRPCGSGAAQALLFFAVGVMGGAASSGLERLNDAPEELKMFRLTACSGRVRSDSQKTRSGNLLLTLRLHDFEIEGAGFRARIEWPGRGPELTVITNYRDDVPAGQSFHFARMSAIDTEKSLYFASSEAAVAGKKAMSQPEALRWACKKGFRRQIARVSGSTFPLAEALLIGIRDDLDAEVNALFRDAGCAHILSLSGQHLAILCTLVSVSLRKIIKNQALLEWLSFGFAALYTWIVGVSPPLLRSVYMMGFGLIFRSLDRPQDSFTILACCFSLSLALDPDSARSLSFLLSYAAMVGLIVYAPRWQGLLWRLPKVLAQPVAASLAALCSTAPIQINAFGTLTLGGVVSSTLSGPLILLFMWSLLGACALVGVAPFLQRFLVEWHQFVYAAIMLSMKIGASLPRVAAESMGEKVIAGAAVAVASFFVYASPYLEWMHFYAAEKRWRCF